MEDRKIQKLKNKLFQIFSQEKYLQIAASALISQVTFSASDCNINTKFVLTFYQQNPQPGLLVDIRSLADDIWRTPTMLWQVMNK
jgi:hypothetical protein